MGFALKRIAVGLLPMLGLFALLVASLYFMSDATQNSDRFGRLYVWLLLANTLLLAFLTILIGINLYEMLRQVWRREPGSQLTLRLMLIFVGLAIVPVSIVYYFSLKFLERGIDSWFDVRIERSLEDAIELSRSSLEFRLRQHLREVEEVASQLRDVPEELAALTLADYRTRLGALELTLVGPNNRILASSSEQTASVVPSFPADEVLMQVGRGESFVGLEPVRDTGLNVRVVVQVPTTDPIARAPMLQAIFPVAERISSLAVNVQGAFAQYKELVYLRTPLKQSFTITLSLVLLLSVLFAVWTAFYSSRRLVAPIRELAEGTKAVAEGDLHRKLPVNQKDELGFLVRSFNEMTGRLAAARDEADRSQRQAENQRAYLQAVLQHLSSGVLTLDRNLVLRMANAAAEDILAAPLELHLGRRIGDVARNVPMLGHLYEAILPRISGSPRDWQEQVTVFGGGGRKMLMCRGAPLPDSSGLKGGQVLVFDDVTTLIQAQRDAAWGEVARRLAHEIKNPLTPIQLSAERLQRKLGPALGKEDNRVLGRSTETIVQQVEAMKAMVNAFSEYARAPSMQVQPVDINALIAEVVDLYRGSSRGIRIVQRLEAKVPVVEADAGRLRQLLHNLIKNALEALDGRKGGELVLSTRCMAESGCRFIEFVASDNGPGVDPSMLTQLFEPYVTGKPKGTGLGLAIVKKIVEEHGGIVWAENRREGGAKVIIRLPVTATRQEEGVSHDAHEVT